MKNLGLPIVLAFLVVIFCPGQGWAQMCPNPIPIQCNQTVTGDSTSGPMNFDSYPGNCTGFSENGPEDYYVLTVGIDIDVTVVLSPFDFDSALAALPASGNDCNSSVCLAGDDTASAGSEEITFPATANTTYYIVVDSWDDFGGSYELSVDCLACTDTDNDGHDVPGIFCPDGDDCDDTDPAITTGTDSDGDGHAAFDPVTCPIGTDCDDLDDTIHQGATEICGDGIDQDCDGTDPVCPHCATLGAIACDSSIAANNAQAGATDLVEDYACLPYSETSSEVAWTFSPSSSGEVRIRLQNTTADLALAVIPASGPCAGSACIAGTDQVFGPGDETLLVDLEAGQDYFVVVDGWSSSVGDFSLIIDCAGCTDGDSDGHADLFCGGTDCDDADPQVNPDALEACDLIDNNCDGQIDEGFDLNVDPNHCGTCTTVCSGVQVCNQGTCAAGCAIGLSPCNGGCYDLQADLGHCGVCDNACDVPNAENGCQAGQCVVSGCLSGYDDCNADPVDGCEIDLLTDVDHCSTCGQICAGYDNASAECHNGNCAIGICDPGFGNCNGSSSDGCETETSQDTTHCGECANACQVTEFCVAGGCTGQCPDGLDNCGGVCIPTDEDPRNCGGCGRVCQFDNSSDPLCEAGSCVLGLCDPGFGDCNENGIDGCETLFGSLDHCQACLDSCSYANAKGLCLAEGCVLDECNGGWTDCNESDLDGCEIHTSGDKDNCGACGITCARLENCVGGICVVGCEDSDSDGFASASCGGTDCDDTDQTSYPGAPEVCDGLDNDCDGVLDDGFDSDGDGYLDEAACEGEGLDCDDQNARVHPGAVEYCGDGIDQDCSGADLSCECPDADRDGAQDALCGGEDCNDFNTAVHPNAEEICNGVDDDCDGAVDEGSVCKSGGKGCGCGGSGESPDPIVWLTLSLLMGAMVLRRRS